MAIIDGYRETRKKIKISFPAKLRKWPQIWKWWMPRNLPISTDLPTVTVFFSRTRTLGLEGHAQDIQGLTLWVGQYIKCTTKHAGTQCTSRPCKQRLAWHGQWYQSGHAYKGSPVEENTLFTIFLNEFTQLYFSREQFPMQVFWFIISIICSTWKNANKYSIIR
jgi:hypothetical protein